LTTIQYCLKEMATPSEKPASRNVDVAGSQVSKILRMADETIDLIKHKSDSRTLSLEKIDVNALIRHTAETLEQLTRDKNIALELELCEGLPKLDALGDSLEQVLINLVTNASKFTDAGGTIRIESKLTGFAQDRSASASSCLYGTHDVAWQDSFATISVTDNGRGMDQAECKRIFERYARVRQADDNGRMKGYGLGLYICRNIVEQHGGRVWATS